MNKDFAIIGDVHACYYTFKALLKKIDLQKSSIVQVGDLIDRGNHPVKLLDKAIKMEQEQNAIFLLGNHEYEFIKYIERGYNDNWLRQGGKETIDQLEQSDKGLRYYYEWIKKRPIYFENRQIFVSHAGICDDDSALDINSNKGILWTRSPLKKINKLQVHGHTPIRFGSALYNKSSNSWNIDTAACYGNSLTCLLINRVTAAYQLRRVDTISRDIS